MWGLVVVGLRFWQIGNKINFSTSLSGFDFLYCKMKHNSEWYSKMQKVITKTWIVTIYSTHRTQKNYISILSNHKKINPFSCRVSDQQLAGKYRISFSHHLVSQKHIASYDIYIYILVLSNPMPFIFLGLWPKNAWYLAVYEITH